MGKGKRTSRDRFDAVMHEFNQTIKQDQHRTWPTMVERCIANGTKAKIQQQQKNK